MDPRARPILHPEDEVPAAAPQPEGPDVRPILAVEGLGKSFGGLKAVQNVSLEAWRGQILSVIGPNGAGKTTLFNCLSGIYRPDRGRVLLAGHDVTGRRPHEVCRQGLSRTFQNIRLFPEMTALQNVQIGQFIHSYVPAWKLLLRTPAYRAAVRRGEEEAMAFLAAVGLQDHAREWARNLPYGLQRRLEIARALATRPRILLLDEPGAGMNPSEIGATIRLIDGLRAQGIAIVLIEHHMKVVMEISDRVLVLDHGEPIAAGLPADIRRDERVIEAYLGRDHEGARLA